MRRDFTISPTYLAGVIDAASDDELESGRAWYPTEGEWVTSTAHVYEATPDQVAGITAVLSNNSPWDETGTRFPGQHTNKLTTITMLDILCDHPDRLETAALFATQRQRREAREIYENPEYLIGPELGPKRYPFAANLLGDYTKFTLDQMGWGAVIGWLGTLNSLPAITPRRRLQAEAAYQWVADQLDVELAVAQSIVWVPYRRIRKEGR